MSNIIYNGGGEFRRRLMMNQINESRPDVYAGDLVVFSEGSYVTKPLKDYIYTDDVRGVVAIPGWMMPDGRHRCVTLSNVSAPGNGWNYIDEVLMSTERTDVPYSDNTVSGIIKYAEWGYLPSNIFLNSNVSIIDKYSYYSESSNRMKVPSAYCGYLRNDSYFTYNQGSPALLDFNGYQNTQNAINNGSEYSSAPVVCNDYLNYSSYREGNFRVPTGLPTYLPSIGELAIAFMRLKEINESLSVVGRSMDTGYNEMNYLSSTNNYSDVFYWYTYGYAIDFANGEICTIQALTYKDRRFVRPFFNFV